MSNEVNPNQAMKLLHKTMLNLEKANLQGMEKAMLFAEGEAKKNCPVDEGHLRNSMGSKAVEENGEIKGVLYNTAEYAIWIHQGTGIYAVNGDGRPTPWRWEGQSKKWEGKHITSGQKPKPFMREAIDNNIEKITEIITKEATIK
ncbi:HK97-gp10 family putative phage morphogenesis protein [Hathewaya histolytica]|uniref:HK97-gp10 family putative phage morphogenesis protein n=1 Tax=Hathewaya histolytica TaxID=1498 RepID=UPI003B682B2F